MIDKTLLMVILVFVNLIGWFIGQVHGFRWQILIGVVTIIAAIIYIYVEYKQREVKE